MRRLAANPLLLRILALIHRTGAQLPQKRIELYRLTADTLARTWRMSQGIAEMESSKESNSTTQAEAILSLSHFSCIDNLIYSSVYCICIHLLFRLKQQSDMHMANLEESGVKDG